MSFSDYFPIWNKMTPEHKQRLTNSAEFLKVKAGSVVHNGSMDCLGLLLIQTGQLRVYTLSSEGREITLYRLFDHDICLFSASCVMPNIQFEVIIEPKIRRHFFYGYSSCAVAGKRIFRIL